MFIMSPLNTRNKQSLADVGQTVKKFEFALSFQL